MVISINRLVGGGRTPMAGFKTTDETHHSFDIMSHQEQIIFSSHFPSVLFSSVLTPSCQSALRNHSQVTVSLTLPLTLSLLSFSLHSTPSISEHFVFPVYLSTLLHLHPSTLNLSHSFPLTLVLLPYGVIAWSQASIFMTIIEARMLMPPNFSLPVSQQQH